MKYASIFGLAITLISVVPAMAGSNDKYVIIINPAYGPGYGPLRWIAPNTRYNTFVSKEECETAGYEMTVGYAWSCKPTK
jgi:hypothetical protein